MPSRAGDAALLRLRLDEARGHYQGDDLARLFRVAVAFGRYRVARELRFSGPPGFDWPRFLCERALPQVPIGGDAERGFAVDEAMLGEIAAELGEPVAPLLAATVRLMLEGGSRHVAKLYVLARLSGDRSLVEALQPAFDARAADPRRALPDAVRRRFPVELVQRGDDDDYNPKSAHLFRGGGLVIKESLALHLDPTRVGGYSEEREILAALDHPRAVRLLDVAAAGRHQLLLLERADGATLDGTRLPRAQALRAGAELADLLAWLHTRGILYLDLKPANLLHDGRHVTLCDFGMARRGRRVTSVPSTLEYVPPEMAREFSATPAADLFQLGLVLHRLLTGRHPFSDGEGADVALANLWDEPDLEELGPERGLIGALLARRPEDRPDAAAAHAALARLA